jgi:pilus assembly protein Flp/PilA
MGRPTSCGIGGSVDTEIGGSLLEGEDMLRLWTAYQARFMKDEEGASMVEYALLVALIAVVVIAGALFLGNEISGKFSEVGETVDST